MICFFLNGVTRVLPLLAPQAGYGGSCLGFAEGCIGERPVP
jgi:hypothetical protein